MSAARWEVRLECHRARLLMKCAGSFVSEQIAQDDSARWPPTRRTSPRLGAPQYRSRALSATLGNWRGLRSRADRISASALMLAEPVSGGRLPTRAADRFARVRPGVIADNHGNDVALRAGTDP
jgi:hypothetical protein